MTPNEQSIKEKKFDLWNIIKVKNPTLIKTLLKRMKRQNAYREKIIHMIPYISCACYTHTHTHTYHVMGVYICQNLTNDAF